MEIREEEKKTVMASNAFWGALICMVFTLLWVLYIVLQLNSPDLYAFATLSSIYLIWPLTSLFLCSRTRKAYKIAGVVIQILYWLVFFPVVIWLDSLELPRSSSADDGLTILVAGFIVDIAVLVLFLVYLVVKLLIFVFQRKTYQKQKE